MLDRLSADYARKICARSRALEQDAKPQESIQVLTEAETALREFRISGGRQDILDRRRELEK